MSDLRRRRRRKNSFMATLRKGEYLKPEEFVLIAAKQLTERIMTRGGIKDVEFIPPKLGSRGFGKFYVEYKEPLYEVDVSDVNRTHVASHYTIKDEAVNLK